METTLADLVIVMTMNAPAVDEQRVPLAPFAFVRIFLGLMWLYEALRDAPWAWPAAVVGFLMLVGLLTPVSSFFGGVLTAFVYSHADSPAAWGTWPWLYWAVMLMHLVVLAAAAGRLWGLDSLPARRAPLWPFW